MRWALALLIDIKAVSMASYRGAATISAIGVPPTGTHPEFYHGPLEDWLKAFELDTGKRKIKPYDADHRQADRRHAAASMGDQIPTDAEDDGRGVRHGLVEDRPAGGDELLEKAGFKKVGNSWMTPDGKPFTVRVMVEGDVAAGHDARRLDDRRSNGGSSASTPRSMWRRARWSTRRAAGDFDTIISWSVETWGGHQDLSYFLDSWHSQFVAAAGHAAAAAQLAALVEPRARQDHRADPHGRLRRSEGRRTRARLREARGARDADHPADGLQRVHGDGPDLLDGLPDRATPTPIRCRTGATRATCSSG